MRKVFQIQIMFVIVLLSANLQACSSMQQIIQGTPTFTPTITFTPSPTSTPTSTLTPTASLTSTPTPNATATEFANRSDFMLADIQKYVDLGYLPDTTGTYSELPDFEENFSQINWYQWWRSDFLASAFVVKAHFSWNTANESPYISGCGLVLESKSNSYYTQVFILHRSKVVVLRSGGYDVNPSKGSGHVDIPSPMEADFTLITDPTNKFAYVLVNDEFVGKYKLEKVATYNLGFVIFSGTSTGYGTHCEITDTRIWKIR